MYISKWLREPVRDSWIFGYPNLFEYPNLSETPNFSEKMEFFEHFKLLGPARDRLGSKLFEFSSARPKALQACFSPVDYRTSSFSHTPSKFSYRNPYRDLARCLSREEAEVKNKWKLTWWWKHATPTLLLGTSKCFSYLPTPSKLLLKCSVARPYYTYIIVP